MDTQAGSGSEILQLCNSLTCHLFAHAQQTQLILYLLEPSIQHQVYSTLSPRPPSTSSETAGEKCRSDSENAHESVGYEFKYRWHVIIVHLDTGLGVLSMHVWQVTRACVFICTHPHTHTHTPTPTHTHTHARTHTRVCAQHLQVTISIIICILLVLFDEICISSMGNATNAMLCSHCTTG